MKLLIFVVSFLPILVFAEEAAVAAELPWHLKAELALEKILVDIDKIVGAPAVIGVAAALEIIMRLVKSKKPLSIAHGIIGILKVTEKILEKLIAGLDKVIPQKLEEEE